MVEQRVIDHQPDALGATPAFVGRERELAELRRCLEMAQGGAGSAVLIAGEPGIGKTRLAEELAARACQAGARVFWGRAYEGPGAPAFWPWVQIIRSAIQDRAADELRAEMGPGAADIAELVPEVRERLPGLPAPPSLDPTQARFRLFESTTTFLVNAAAGRPLVLVLDDLQWADTSSLLLLEFLARGLRQSRVLVVGTYRDAEVGRRHPLARTLGVLARLGCGQPIVLDGLTEGDVARFIEITTGLAPPADLVTTVAKETDGNPFFVTEIVRLLAAEGQLEHPAATQAWTLTVPPTVRAVIGQRLDHLSELCQSVLTSAAVIGREFGLNILERVSGLSNDRLLEVVEEAELAGIVAEAPQLKGSYRFAHILIRETLYEELSSARRIRLHRRVGEALAALDEPNRQAHLAELAHHFYQAMPGGCVEQAITYAQQAGDRALTLLAYEEAAISYERALQALDLREPADQGLRCELLLALTRALARAGDTGKAQAAARRAADLARELRAPEQLAEAALGFEESVAIGVVDPFLVGLLEEAWAALGEAPGGLRARVMARLAMELHWSNVPDRAAQLSQQALTIAREVGDPLALATALRSRHFTLQGPHDLQQRLGIATELIRLGEARGDRDKAAWGRFYRLMDLLELGEIRAFDTELQVQAQLAHELRQPHHLWQVAIARAMRAHLDGRLDESERLAQAAFAIGQRMPNPNVADVFSGQMFVVRTEQGRLAELEPVVKGIAHRPSPLPVWRCALAFFYSQVDQVAEARQEFEQLAAGGFAGLSRDLLWFPSLAYLSEVCAGLGDAQRAARLYELLVPYAGRSVMLSVAICYGSAARYLALLATTMARWPEATRHFEAALAMHAKMGAGLWLARTQYDYAKMLLTRGSPGDRDQALPLLAQALATARALGLPRLAEQAAALQDQETVGRVPTAASYPDGLTAREVEVLRLLAAGRTSNEIAGELVISVATVYRHVSNLYGKIGARGRADATAYALSQGLARPRRSRER